MSMELNSSFACYLQGMLDIKRNSGYSMEHLVGHLEDFDRYCVKNGVESTILDKELAEGWALSVEGMSPWWNNDRLCAMRHLGEYLLALGIDAYVPTMRFKEPRPKPPQLLTDEQLAEFFEAADSLEFSVQTPFRHLVAPVMYRLIYCCGLRSSEACRLQVEDVDLNSGRIMIRKSKRRKDRVVYASLDVLGLCQAFDARMQTLVPTREFFFPYQDRRGYDSNLVTLLYDKILKMTSFCGTTSKKPTCHGLRHLFAVNSMRKCMEEGRDFGQAIHYLSRYLGHEGPEQTLYYLHSSPSIAGAIRTMAEGLNDVIGGGWYVED